jgi:phosphoribosyl 1,2-cyclic phosphodiesterase
MANDLADVNNLVLIHLSNTNSDAEYFRQAITSATGIIPKIARPGMIIPFNKYEF